MSCDLVCPWCRDGDFDEIGLKAHLSDCESFSLTLTRLLLFSQFQRVDNGVATSVDPASVKVLENGSLEVAPNRSRSFPGLVCIEDGIEECAEIADAKTRGAREQNAKVVAFLRAAAVDTPDRGAQSHLLRCADACEHGMLKP